MFSRPRFGAAFAFLGHARGGVALQKNNPATPGCGIFSKGICRYFISSI
jgi:hypothetical protein